MLLVAAFILTSVLANAQSKAAIEWYNKGIHENDLNKKIEYYSKAINIDPNFTLAYNNRGVVYKNLKRYDEAIADYNRAINTKPNFGMAYNNRGIAYFYLKKYNEAIADFTKTISLEPNNPNPYFDRGYTYETTGRISEAKRDYQKACDLGAVEACKELKK